MRIWTVRGMLLLVLSWPAASAAQVRGDVAAVYRDHAATLYARGDLVAAIEQIEKAIGCCPDESFFLFMLGNAFYRAGRLTKAAEAYEAFLTKQPDDFEAHISLGFALRRLGDAPGTLRQWRTALRLEPTSPLARAVLAVAFFESGDLDDAAIQFSQAVNLDTRYNESRNLAIDIRWNTEMRRAFDEVKRFATNRDGLVDPRNE